jgi:hypothetical protein
VSSQRATEEKSPFTKRNVHILFLRRARAEPLANRPRQRRIGVWRHGMKARRTSCGSVPLARQPVTNERLSPVFVGDMPKLLAASFMVRVILFNVPRGRPRLLAPVRWRLIVRVPKSTTSARDHDVSGMAPPSRMMRAHRSRIVANISNMAAPICKKICRPWRTILPAVNPKDFRVMT